MREQHAHDTHLMTYATILIALLALALAACDKFKSPTAPVENTVPRSECGGYCDKAPRSLPPALEQAAIQRGRDRVRAAINAGTLRNRENFNAWDAPVPVEYTPCCWWSISNGACAWSQALVNEWRLKVSTWVREADEPRHDEVVAGRVEWEAINLYLCATGNCDKADVWDGFRQ